MAKRQRSQRKKQEKALKKRTERKRKLAQQKAQSITPVRGIRQARSFPIEGCWVQEHWQEAGMAIIAIARRQRDGALTFGVYLVDYYCLGVKNTFYNINIPTSVFQSKVLRQTYRKDQPIEIAPALAHEIVYGAIEYARQFGFRPHRDFKWSQYILDPSDTYPHTGKVEFGKDGKPFYVAGPNDNAQQVIRQLERTAGEGNFYVMSPLITPIDDKDTWEEEEEEDEEGETDQSTGLWVPGAEKGERDPSTGLWTPQGKDQEKDEGEEEEKDETDSPSGLWVPGR